MVSYLHTDFESRGTVELQGNESVGLHNYWTHPQTEPLMLSWSYADEPVELWQMHLGLMPDKLRKGLEDKNQMLAAFNSPFERYGFKYKIGIDIPIERWADPQASARYLSLPASLDKVGTVLNLPFNLAKDARGEALIDLFCYPHYTKKKRGEEPVMYWNDWNTHPSEWLEFCNYCRQDTVAERELMRRMTMLKAFPLPPFEREIWEFDQLVNDRGMPTDVQFVTNAYTLAERSKQEHKDALNTLTGLENANSTQQMLAWVQERGYEPNTLRKDTLTSQLKYNTSLTDACRQGLILRQAASSTTYKKLGAIIRQVSSDGRLRNQFIYMGSSRCGRWSGNAVQLHNMARPGVLKNARGEEYSFEEDEVTTDARNMIYRMDYDGILDKYGSVLLTVKNCIRTVFDVPAGIRFNVCDLNAIETRVGAWVSQCAPLLAVFAPRPGKPNGNDPYIDFATKMTGILYEMIERDMKSKDKLIKAAAKRYRQVAKPGVLGCIYRLSGGGWGVNKYGDPVKTGLWGYAEAMGVEMTQEQAHEVVRIFRESYKEIVQAWFDLEDAIEDVLTGERTKRTFGPNGCVKIDKLTIRQDERKRYILRIQLPSGRYLHYIDAQMMEVRMPWKDAAGNDVYKDSFCYSGLDQETKVWKQGITSHGGKVFENIVQGIARDILAAKLLKFEKIGISICGHVHDEGIGETKNDIFSPGLKHMISIMSEEESWAPGLLLGADGFEGQYYHK